MPNRRPRADEPQRRTYRRGLTPREEKFCLVFVTEHVAAAAYRAAYSVDRMLPERVRSKASEVMSRPLVIARIEELRQQAADLAVLTESKVLGETARIGLCDPANMFDEITGELLAIQDMSPGMRAAIASIEIEHRKDGQHLFRVSKIKLWSKTQALDMLLKHLGSYERDNKQRAGVFDKVPKAELDQIVETLRALNRPDAVGELVPSSASRFTH